MFTVTITSKQYADLYGCSQRYVNRQLSNGIGMPYMVKFSKLGNSWMIEVQKQWYLNKTEHDKLQRN